MLEYLHQGLCIFILAFLFAGIILNIILSLNTLHVHVQCLSRHIPNKDKRGSQNFCL